MVGEFKLDDPWTCLPALTILWFQNFCSCGSQCFVWFLLQQLAHWQCPWNIKCSQLYTKFPRRSLTKTASKLVKISLKVPQYMVPFETKYSCQKVFMYFMFSLTAVTSMFKLCLAITPSIHDQYSSFRIGGAVPTVFSYFSEVLAREKRGEHLSWLCMFWMIGGIYASAMAWAIIPYYGKKRSCNS